MSTRFLSFAVLGTLTLGMTLGCSSKKSAPAVVSGKVTYKGEPVTGGTLVFFTEQGVYPVAVSAEGTFTHSDLPEGACTVTIDTEELNPNRKVQAYDQKSNATSGGPGGAKYKSKPAPSASGAKGKQETSPAGEGSPQGERGQYKKIPPQYADKDKSPLKVTLKAGSQELNFDLTD